MHRLAHLPHLGTGDPSARSAYQGRQEEGNDTAEQQVYAKVKSKQPNHENIYDRSYHNRVPHGGGDTRGHAVEARSSIFEEGIELGKS
jgi:hypothetical protein